MQNQPPKAPTFEIARRPKEPAKTGEIDEIVEIETNFRRFSFNKLYSYTFEVSTQGRKAKKNDTYKVFRNLYEIKKFGPNVFPAFDENMIYSSVEFGNQKRLNVNLDGKQYIAILKFSAEIDFSLLKNYIEQDNYQILDSRLSNLLRVLNIYLNSDVRSRNLTLGRRTFPIPDRPQYLYGGLELMFGFYQSVRIGWNQLLVNHDICATTYYPSGKLIDLLSVILSHVNLHKGLYEKDIQYLKRFLKNLRFITTYSTSEKTITDVTFQSASKQTFMKDEVQTTVKKYYEDSGLPLVYPNLPCIIVKKGYRTSFFPLEVCVLVRGQKHKTDDLTQLQQEDMIKKTVIGPNERFDKIKKGIQKEYKHGSDKRLQSISFKVDNIGFLKLKSKKLFSPPINVNNKQITTEKGEWEIIKFNKCADLYNWSVVCFDLELKISLIETAIRLLKEVLISKGLNVPHMPKISINNCQDYKKAIMLAVQDSLIEPSKPAQLIICIIPRKQQEEDCLYAKIKRICYLELGIMNQCILTKGLKDNRRLRQVFNNMALKINAKLNGENSRLADGQLDFKCERAHMVFAADVYHPSRDDKKKGRPSVSAICGSMNDTLTEYCCRYRMNEKLRHDVDIIENLNDMVLELFEQRKTRGLLPDQIIFYRDGVGETQFETVIADELEPLLVALENYYKSENLPPPKLTFMIIQKRHHASQTGTARSGFYHVILNQGNYSAAEIYNLTFRLCFLSSRCSRSLSQVTPASYAHNIANLARYFVEYRPISNERGHSKGRGRGRGRGGNNLGSIRPEKVQDGKWHRVESKLENEQFFL
ncbi:10347_t:CDS:10 [Cetraspora pellucida]|uniref:10347_t:CDS:1 n=1 Tax=Cetraspora pellucida TaxID=1433469 RepID=A0ACA9L8L0_9GLOM|nr:10347_t:CDS:10 [Cetraspora pellucida]